MWDYMITSNENLSKKDKRGEQMPIKEENLILNLINSETGKELCRIDNLKDNLLSVESRNYSFDQDRKALNSFIDLSARSLSIDISIGAISLTSLIGIDVANAPDKYNFQIIKVKQARKHKKKRIFFSASLIISPVEIVGIFNSLLMISACVPLPAPGAPKNINFIFFSVY